MPIFPESNSCDLDRSRLVRQPLNSKQSTPKGQAANDEALASPQLAQEPSEFSTGVNGNIGDAVKKSTAAHVA